MLDVRLAAALLQALPTRAQSSAGGRHRPAASVGAGNVLKDLIAAGAGLVTRLDVIYRQQGQS